MSASEPAILCTGLNKSFKFQEKQAGFWGTLKAFASRKTLSRHAVQNFDMSVAPGEIVGLLGPNGAGKTTLMKMMTGIVVPSSGTCRILGYVPEQRQIDFRKSIALVMGQKSQLWWDIPANDSFQLLQRYYELEAGAFQKRLQELTKILQVEKLLGVHVRKLSLGERMKMELIACLLHDPRVIFLDEPSIGLDIVSQNSIRQFLLSYHAKYKPTIIITSHYMADIAALCSRIVLILGGEKKFDGSVKEFEGLLGDDKIVTLYFTERVNELRRAEFQSFEPLWGEDFYKVELKIPAGELGKVLAEILASFPVEDLHTDKMPIEKVMETLLKQPALLSPAAKG